MSAKTISQLQTQVIEPSKLYAGVPIKVIIYHLWWCFHVRDLNHEETRKFFVENLGLSDWTINKYLNLHEDQVTVWAEGQDTFLHYDILQLPILKNMIGAL